MRLLAIPLLVMAVASCCVGPASALAWTYVGVSGDTTNPAGLMDRDRIKFGDVVVDAAGNVYAVTNNGENATYAYLDTENPTDPAHRPAFTDRPGGVTIFQPGGGKIQAKTSTAVDGAWSTVAWGASYNPATYGGRTDNKCTGAITKLVLGGDGKVYGLLNYLEINWDGTRYRQNQSIVRINSNGSVDCIWTPKWLEYLVQVFPPTWALKGGAVEWTGVWSEISYKIRGLTVGGDGKIYWTMNGSGTGGENVWRKHLLWRYNKPGDGSIEENPTNAETTGDQKGWGWGVTTRLVDLEYVGDDRFAIAASGGGFDGNWYLDGIKWADYPLRRGATYSQSKFGNSYRDRYTQLEYDPTHKLLWASGRSAGVGPYTEQTDSNSGSFNIVDLGGGNNGIQITKYAAKKRFYSRETDVGDADSELSLACRFRVDSYSADFNAAIVVLAPKNRPAPDPNQSPQGILKISGGRFILVNDQGQQTADLGVADSNWHELHMCVSAKTATIEAWYDGTAKPVVDPRGAWGGLGRRVYIGGGASDYAYGSLAGSITVTYDWVMFAKKIVRPSDRWPVEELLACEMDGSVYPNQYARTNWMTRWSGDADPANPDPGHAGLFVVDPGTGNNSLPVRYYDGLSPHPYSPNADNWPANGNTPSVSAVPNRGEYWVTAMAVDPNTGYCWYSVISDANYAFGNRGHILVRGVNSWEFYDLGEVAANKDIVGLGFGNGLCYALAVDKTSGAYDLYSVTPPADYTVQKSLQQAKNTARGVMTTIGNDRPLIVTLADDSIYSRYAYVEEVNDAGVPLSGIKVVPGNDGVLFPVPPGTAVTVGDQVRLVGYTEVVDGEAQFRCFGSEVLSQANTVPPALTMQVKGVGGIAAGLQPTLDPHNGPSNVGLLSSVAGTVAAVIYDDQSTRLWFTIDDGSGAQTIYLGPGGATVAPGLKVNFYPGALTPGTFVTVTGVSAAEGVQVDAAPLPKLIQRQIIPRTDLDIKTYP